jgi:NAD(P)-dependent dehydrogenase (short-subunit alcohol dehydrogenase family)
MDLEQSFNLKGKVAMVTGGSRGLGWEIAQAFGACGADLIIASRKLDACQEAASKLNEDHGCRAVAIGCHVGHWDEMDRLADRSYEEFGRVDVLVNNAGMSPLYPSLPEVSEDLFDKVVAVNLKGPFRLTALVGSRMAEGDGGSIINVSSVGSIRPTPVELPYAAAKAGLDVLTSGYALALGPKVRVNTLMAGPFLTDISKAWDIEASEKVWARYPARRAGRPSEIAGAALYLASDLATYTTGAVLRVDGGMGIAV